MFEDVTNRVGFVDTRILSVFMKDVLKRKE